MGRSVVRISIVLPSLGAALCAVCLAYLASASAAAEPNRIVANVRVAGVSIGGLTAAEALNAVSSVVARELDRKVVLYYRDEEYETTLRDLGAEADVKSAVEEALALGNGRSLAAAIRETVAVLRDGYVVDMPVVFRRQALEAGIAVFAQMVRSEPLDARAEVVEGELRITPHKYGVVCDVKATADAVIAAVGGQETIRVRLVAKETRPAVLVEDLQNLVLLSTFTTRFSTGQANRAANIRLAAKLIDGKVVAPGAVFSVNQATGRRTSDRGFLMAPVFSGNRVVSGVGGGVCQIATTVYNAALEAGLKIIERHPHSLPVNYVPPGRDAAVSWGSADMRFQNTTAWPIVVRVKVDGGGLTVSLLGRRDPKPATAEPEVEPVTEEARPAGRVVPKSEEPVTRSSRPYNAAPSSQRASAE